MWGTREGWIIISRVISGVDVFRVAPERVSYLDTGHELRGEGQWIGLDFMHFVMRVFIILLLRENYELYCYWQ